jgi:phosphatidylglycerophosphatase A
MIVFRPTPAFAYARPARIVAFGFGAGLARFAPGTFGTLAAWPLGWMLAGMHPVLAGPLLTALFLIGVWACGATSRELGISDHGSIVWDEIVAFLIILLVLPGSFAWQLAGFVVFRAFDIGKPPPIRWIERRYRGGFGVMFDDLVAAGYTLLLLAVVRRLVQ